MLFSNDTLAKKIEGTIAASHLAYAKKYRECYPNVEASSIGSVIISVPLLKFAFSIRIVHNSENFEQKRK